MLRTFANAGCTSSLRVFQLVYHRVRSQKEGIHTVKRSMALARHMASSRKPLTDVLNHQPGRTSPVGKPIASGKIHSIPSETQHRDLKIASRTGSIEIITGPMFAGKTTALLKRVADCEARGLTVAVVKSDKDTRYAVSEVVSHSGERKHCFAVATLQEFYRHVEERFSCYEVIAIDEGQFFPDLLDFCTDAADNHKKQVIVAGLDGDYRRRKFGQVLDLLPVSDTVTKLSARCSYCDSNALFSLRIVADERQEVVGGSDKYAPVCRNHYNSLSTVTSPSCSDSESDSDAKLLDSAEC